MTTTNRTPAAARLYVVARQTDLPSLLRSLEKRAETAVLQHGYRAGPSYQVIVAGVPHPYYLQTDAAARAVLDRKTRTEGGTM